MVCISSPELELVYFHVGVVINPRERLDKAQYKDGTLTLIFTATYFEIVGKYADTWIDVISRRSHPWMPLCSPLSLSLFQSTSLLSSILLCCVIPLVGGADINGVGMSGASDCDSDQRASLKETRFLLLKTSASNSQKVCKSWMSKDRRFAAKRDG